MRSLSLALAAFALTAPCAMAQAASIADALACERQASPGECLIRAGAHGWGGDDMYAEAVIAVIVSTGMDEGSLAIAENEYSLLPRARAMAEAARREAAGAPLEDVLAPIAALSEDIEDRGDVYIDFAIQAEHFPWPQNAWRFRAASEPIRRLALRRAQGLLRSDDESGWARLALAYAHAGLEGEARAAARRVERRELLISVWIALGDLSAAERALRANENPHPIATLTIANAAIDTGDAARARRLALEVLDGWVRGRNNRIIITFNRVALADMAGAVLAANGDNERLRLYAAELMEGRTPSDALYGSHAEYAMTLLEAAGDDGGACTIARNLAAAIETPVAEDPEEERRARALHASVALARCGEHDAARALAARYGVEDFWLTYHLGEPLDPNDPPYAGGLMNTIERDAETGRLPRANEALHVLFVRSPNLAAATLYDARQDRPELLAAWRSGGAFAALRARMLGPNRTLTDPLNDQDRDAIFAAALSLLDAP